VLSARSEEETAEPAYVPSLARAPWLKHMMRSSEDGGLAVEENISIFKKKHGIKLTS
jgi:hypothetical protein